MPETFTIRVETHFRASHRLRLPDGSMEPAHGHDWCVIVHISSHRLDKMGLVMNFQKLKAMLNEAVKDFEEVDLDAIDYFRRNNPSAENVAKYVYERLGGRLPKTVKLRTVSVMEEPSCWASYSVE